MLMVFFSSRISPSASAVIFFERSPFATAVVTSAMLRTCDGEVRGHVVDRVGQVFPRAGDALDLGLPAELPFRADFARHARDFRGERAELVDHRVDGLLQLEDLAACIDGDLLGEVAVRDGGGDCGDVANLVGQVRGHVVDGVGEIAPRTADALHVRLTAELSFRCRLRARRA